MSNLISSKFLRLIKTLNEDEVRSFEAWLNSPWCNSNKNTTKLFQVLKKYFPDFESKKLTKEKIFKRVLPNGKFSDRRMNNLLSDGYLALEKFIVFQKFSNQPILQKDLLTREFLSRNLENWFFKDINKEISKLEEKHPKDWEEHVELLQFYHRAYYSSNDKDKWQAEASNLDKINENIDVVFLLEKALSINEMISRNRFIKDENYEIDKHLKKWIEVSKDNFHPSVELYRIRFAYNPQNMFERFNELKEKFFEIHSDLNKLEQRVHFVSLINDNVLLIKKGNLDFTSTLPLFKFGLKTGFLLQDGKLSRNSYVTIVSASNTKGDFEFTDYFINEYSKNLSESIREDGAEWAKAHTAYRKGNLTESIDTLLAHQFKDTYFQIVTKILTTQVYFDLFLEDDSYQSFLFNYFDSFEKWIQREKKRSESQKKSYFNFIQLSRALAKHFLDLDFNKEKLEALFENKSNVQALLWLKNKRQQIIELKG